MHPFDIDLLTDDGASFGPSIECKVDCDVTEDGLGITVTHVWVPLYRRSDQGWRRVGEADLLDRTTGAEAWHIGLLAKSQAEADAEFVASRLVEHRSQLRDRWIGARAAVRSI